MDALSRVKRISLASKECFTTAPRRDDPSGTRPTRGGTRGDGFGARFGRRREQGFGFRPPGGAFWGFWGLSWWERREPEPWWGPGGANLRFCASWTLSATSWLRKQMHTRVMA